MECLPFILKSPEAAGRYIIAEGFAIFTGNNWLEKCSERLRR
jgi:hypothetical protein